MRITSFVDAHSGGSLASAEFDSKRLSILLYIVYVEKHQSYSVAFVHINLYLKLLVFEPLKTQW